jgi:hypothetical protein
VTLEQQVSAALRILDPPPTERERCRLQINYALAIISKREETIQLSSFVKSKRLTGAWRAVHKAARRMKAALDALKRAGWGYPHHIDEPALNLLIDYSAPENEYWKFVPISPETKAYSAARLAYLLLDRWGINVTLTRKGPWARLAAELYGDPKADLFRQMRAVKATYGTRPAPAS